jgi:hypothetical protein
MFNPKAITVEDIYAAQRILLSVGLPPEIAAIILDFAEYWHARCFAKYVPLELACPTRQFEEVSSLYLQTSPVGYGDSLDELPTVRPRKVVFNLTSGGNNYRYGNRGLYENDQAWFDASIFREDETWAGGDRQEPRHALHDRVISAAVYAGLDSDQKKLEPGDQYALYYCGHDPYTLPAWFCEDGTRLLGGFKVVHNGRKQTWLLQRIRFPERMHDPVDYAIEWKREEVGEPREEEWPINGAGSGTNFVASLRRGDRIGVWGRTWVSPLDPKVHAKCLLRYSGVKMRLSLSKLLYTMQLFS